MGWMTAESRQICQIVNSAESRRVAAGGSGVSTSEVLIGTPNWFVIVGWQRTRV